MASLQHTKKRLRGIASIHQMTSAMELVAATKMRRAQEAALASRPYAVTALEILANLVEGLEHHNTDDAPRFRHPLTLKRDVRRTCVVVVAADKGLAGSFNSAIFKHVDAYRTAHAKENSSLSFVAIGQKAHDYLKRIHVSIRGEFTNYGDLFHYEDVSPLAELLRNGFIEREWDSIIVFSTHFTSALKQTVLARQLLPLDVARLRETVKEIIPETGRYAELRTRVLERRPTKPAYYLAEPSRSGVMNALLPTLFKMNVYHIILEANASEHSARRMAMKNATDSASELIESLQLAYNRSRQANITKGIIEVTSTSSAIN